MYVDTSNHHTYLTHTVYAMQLINDDASQFLACPGVGKEDIQASSAGSRLACCMLDGVRATDLVDASK